MNQHEYMTVAVGDLRKKLDKPTNLDFALAQLTHAGRKILDFRRRGKVYVIKLMALP
jgi:hypothetical protein